VLLCCGKIYYDLLEAREKRQRNDVAIVRLEQLYPLRDEHLASALEGLKKDTRLIWVQEEPENMGALRYLQARFSGGVLGRFPLELVSRRASASPRRAPTRPTSSSSRN
jgi:2-oxoglutarate dehydrogenase E1 component